MLPEQNASAIAAEVTLIERGRPYSPCRHFLLVQHGQITFREYENDVYFARSRVCERGSLGIFQARDSPGSKPFPGVQ